MESQPQILDSEAINQHYNPQEFLADGGTRFANMVIDTIVFYVLNLAIDFFLGISQSEYTDIADALGSILLSWGVIYLYYFIFESTTGKTPGKMITRTRVVDANGQKVTASAIALRTLVRLVPFEAFSFLGKIPRGWHDSWSKTWVVKDRKN